MARTYKLTFPFRILEYDYRGKYIFLLKLSCYDILTLLCRTYRPLRVRLRLQHGSKIRRRRYHLRSTRIPTALRLWLGGLPFSRPGGCPTTHRLSMRPHLTRIGDYSVRVDLLASTRWLLLFRGGSERCPCIFLAYVHGRPSETFNGSLIRSTTWSCIPPKESSEVAKILPSKPHSQTTPKGKFEHLYRFHQLIPQCRRREG